MSIVLLRRNSLGKGSCKGIQSFSRHNLIVTRIDEGFPEDISMVFRWGCTSNIPTKNVINKATAIHRVNDKSGFRKLLREQIPNIIPPTWFDFNNDGYDDSLPVIVRPQKHAQGKQLWVCNTHGELLDAIDQAGVGYYFSNIINKVAEYRVAFVSGRVVWVANKTPSNPNDIAWNVARGGSFNNVRWNEWPLSVVKIAREAFILSELDFGAVDVMVDDNGRAYILEINSAPSQTSPYRQECMAKGFDWIIENDKEILPIIKQNVGGWRRFIHPALSGEALLV